MKSCPNKKKPTFGIAGCKRDWFFFPCDLRELSVTRSRQRGREEEEAPKPCRSPVGACWRSGGWSLGILLIERRRNRRLFRMQIYSGGIGHARVPPVLTPHEIKNHNTQMTITSLLSRQPGCHPFRVQFLLF